MNRKRALNAHGKHSINIKCVSPVKNETKCSTVTIIYTEYSHRVLSTQSKIQNTYYITNIQIYDIYIDIDIHISSVRVVQSYL